MKHTKHFVVIFFFLVQNSLRSNKRKNWRVDCHFLLLVARLMNKKLSINLDPFLRQKRHGTKNALSTTQSLHEKKSFIKSIYNNMIPSNPSNFIWQNKLWESHAFFFGFFFFCIESRMCCCLKLLLLPFGKQFFFSILFIVWNSMSAFTSFYRYGKWWMILIEFGRRFPQHTHKISLFFFFYSTFKGTRAMVFFFFFPIHFLLLCSMLCCAFFFILEWKCWLTMDGKCIFFSFVTFFLYKSNDETVFVVKMMTISFIHSFI